MVGIAAAVFVVAASGPAGARDGSRAGLGLDPLASAAEAARELLDGGRAAEAKQRIQGARALLRGPLPESFARLEAEAALALGDSAGALAALAGPFGADPGRELVAARALFALDRGEEGETLLRALLERYPSFGRARSEWAQRALGAGRAGEARELLAEVARQAPGELWVRALLARATAADGDGGGAIAELSAVLDAAREQNTADPGWVARQTLVELLLEAGRFGEAFEVSRPMAGAGAGERALLLVVRASLAADRPLAALGAAALALDEAPGSVRALDELSSLAADAPRLALAFAEERRRRAPGADSDRRFVEALLELAARDGQRGAEFLSRARALLAASGAQERGPWALLGVRAARLAGDLTGEAEGARAWATHAGDDPGAHYELGLAEADAGEWERSLAAFGRAAEGASDAQAADAHGNRAALLERLGRHGEAARALEAALEADPERPDFWHRLARLARYRLGDRPRAEAAYRAYFARGGVDPDGRAYLERTPAEERR